MKKRYYILMLALSVIAGTSVAQVVYTGKPRYQIDVKRAGVYIGTVKVELFPNIAYHHTRNFDSLVSVGFYDSTAFHRVIPGFMIQGGDPNSRHGATSTWGFGDPNQPTVNAEFSPAKHVRGILSAARSTNINSATSQFFICVAAASQLNGQYSVYGRVTEGMNVVDTIVYAPRNAQDRPNLKHEMFITAIGSNDTIPLAPSLVTPTNGLAGVNYTTMIQLNWNRVTDAIIYTLEVAYDSLFTMPIRTVDTPNLSFYFTDQMFPYTQYFWRVRANNGGNFGAWSQVYMFDTSEPTEPNPTGLSVVSKSPGIQVYPNPGSGKFNFSNVTLGSKIQIFDLLGKLVIETTVKESTIQLNLEQKEKGVYFYKISSYTKEVAQGKLILK